LSPPAKAPTFLTFAGQLSSGFKLHFCQLDRAAHEPNLSRWTSSPPDSPQRSFVAPTDVILHSVEHWGDTGKQRAFKCSVPLAKQASGRETASKGPLKTGRPNVR